MRRWLSITALIGTMITINALAHPNNLTQINHSIKNIKHWLASNTQQRHQLQHQLRKIELNSSKLSHKLNNTHHKLKHQHHILQQLQKQEAHDQHQLQLQRDILAKELRQAYLLGHQPYLKMLLNQQDPNQLNRIFRYYQYINHSHLQNIKQIQETLAQAKANQAKLHAEYTVLKKLNQHQHNQQQHLAKLEHSRLLLIKKINSRILSKRQQLAQLLDNKRRLEETLSAVEHNQYATTLNHTRFSKLKGKLAWPTKGKILDYYGTQIGQSELRWTGILIKAKDDQPIYAVANGKVVFANWLAGYGLILIINHGNGYMTLYGRNHYLYKKVGDIVHAGDLIASVGKSGGYQSPALYFAVRHNAKPLNPLRWIKHTHV